MDPPRADLRIGYLCNNNCRFCCVGEQRKFNLTTKEVIKELEFAKKNKAEKVVFTGGEPTLRKDIVKLISYASELSFKDILVITNGRMCSYSNFYDKLVDAGLTSICFSLPDIRKDMYEHLTQVKGSFKELIQALDNTQKYDLQVSTITTIMKVNYKILPEITKFLINLRKNIPKIYSELMFINPTDSAWKNRLELVPKISNAAPYIHKSLDIAIEHNYMLNVEAVPFCFMKGYEDRIVELNMAKERVYLDPEKKPDFKFNENRKILGKIKSKYCMKCKFNSICEGVWKNYAKIYGISELKYPVK
ncbi:MAG: radical SAM protein [Candidatus Woesearchaeota archaeon]